ncbi:MAG: GAF domain-containing sensor histidine kinase [Planctomycetota bacterium]|nr:GAF domain-containing sensor histidine kinase [Planctomycetota bacterium]
MKAEKDTSAWESASQAGEETPRGVTPDTIRRWADDTIYDEDDRDFEIEPLTDGETPQGEIISLRLRNRELLAIREIAQRLIAPFHLGEFMYEIITTCCRIMRSEAGSVLLQEAGTGKLHFFWVRGAGADKVREFVLEKGQGVAGWSAETGRSCLVSDPENDPRFFADVDRETGFKTTSILCAPIRGAEGVIGVVEVLNKKGGGRFSAEDLAFLEVLSAEVALAIESFRARENARRRERVALIGSMASSIIHDLRNPMTIIKGHTYLLCQAYPQAREHCRKIDVEIDRLTDLASEILGVAKGCSEARPETTSMAPFIDEFVEFIEARMHLSGIELQVENRFEGEAFVDRNRLRRALLNIVTNSIEAIGTEGKIQIQCQQEGKDLHLSVRDDGPGIPEEVRLKLLDPFHPSGKPGGTGLGMAIVNNIVQAHGGRLEVESSEGKGTCIHLFIPLAPPSAHAPAAGAAPSSPTE